MTGKGLIVLLLFGFTAALNAREAVSIRVSPSVAFAPANLFVRATVDANKENRILEITAESIDFYRSSEVTLDGDRAPRVTLLEFKSVPGGYYSVRAVVKGSRGEELASTHSTVNVVGDAGVQ